MPAPYIALVEDNENFNPITHARRDLFPFRILMTHEDSEYCEITLEVENPKSQLTDLTSKRIILSDGKEAIFDGVISSVPRGLIGDKISVSATGRPPKIEDLDLEVSTMIEGLKTKPYYDLLAVPEGKENDLAEVFAARPNAISFSRIQGQPKLCDINTGSTSISVIPLLDSVDFTKKTDVAKRYGVSVKANWKQINNQDINCDSYFWNFSTFSPEEVIEAFPKKGAKFGDSFTAWRVVAKEEKDEPRRKAKETVTLYQDLPREGEIDPHWRKNQKTEYKFERKYLDLQLSILNKFEIERTESLSFEIDTDIQDAIVERDEEIEEIDLRNLVEASSETRDPWSAKRKYIVGDEVIEGSEVYRCIRDHTSDSSFSRIEWSLVGQTNYISDRSISSFLKTKRGGELIEHLVERVKTRAKFAARSVFVSFETRIPGNVNDISHDCEVTVQSPSLPGGYAVGRLVSYELSWSQDRWSFRGEIACTLGSGGSDTVEMGSVSGNIPSAFGRVDIRIENDGEKQKEKLLESQKIASGSEYRIIEDNEIGVTEITINTIPAPSKSFSQTISVPISGSLGLIKQMDF